MSYLGSKGGAGVYQAIISQMPPHDAYVETHLGSGIVMRLKQPVSRNIGIDLDPLAIDAFDSVIKNDPQFPRYPNDPVLLVRDATDWLKNFSPETFPFSERILIYADPPYLWSTRKSDKEYNFEYSEDDHRALLQQLRHASTAGALVMVSGYPNKLYSELLVGWRSIEFQAMTRGGVATEKLWMNYPANKVHWHDYAGSNFTERQRIKRKAARWASNYARLDAGERCAILAALLETHSK